MSVQKDTITNIYRKIFEQSANAPTLDSLLSELATSASDDAALFEALRDWARLEKADSILAAHETWFQSLGWHLARLFMWGCLAFGLVCLFVWGRQAADPFTFAVLGAAIYYILIQLTTPRRLAMERSKLAALIEEQRKIILARLEKLGRVYEHSK